MRADVLIVGAGPTGLGAAWRLEELGHRDWWLCEAEASAGGLASSVTDEHGFTWDLGGHVQFSHYDYVDRLLDDLLGPDGWLCHERRAAVSLRERFVSYPFQLNLHHLPDAERDVCLAGLDACRANGPPPANFAEWIDRSFGAGIAAIFLPAVQPQGLGLSARRDGVELGRGPRRHGGRGPGARQHAARPRRH